MNSPISPCDAWHSSANGSHGSTRTACGPEFTDTPMAPSALWNPTTTSNPGTRCTSFRLRILKTANRHKNAIGRARLLGTHSAILGDEHQPHSHVLDRKSTR